MEQIQKINNFLKEVKTVSTRFEHDNKLLIIQCNISEDKNHFFMIVVHNRFNSLHLKVDYNSYFINSVTILENIIIKDVLDFKNVLKCLHQLKFCEELFDLLNN